MTALILTRPFVKKVLKAKRISTNADQVIGKTAVVIEDIDNDLAAGRVICMGLDWSARSVDGSRIKAGKKATVERIEGVKLIVKQ
jgi:membrane protein implicated in regulation of membrane protease activity